MSREKPNAGFAFICVIGTLAAAPGLGQAASVYRVPSEVPTIQAAIDLCAAGDTVLVAPGTYTGDSNRNLDFAGINLVLFSEGGAAATIIDCAGVDQALIFDSHEDATAIVDGFTMRNSSSSYGAILCQGSSPTIKNCVIESNAGGFSRGGGISCLGSFARIQNCVITGNSAPQGGGIYASESSNPTIEGCTIEGNTAIGGGGGIACCTATIRDCTITGNSAGFGGGIFVCYQATPDIENCVIAGNQAAGGGGVYSSQAVPDFDGCVVTGNYSSGDGGGLYLDRSGPTITQCTIARNEAAALGNGIITVVSGSTTFTRSILWGNCGSDDLYAGGGTGFQFECSALAQNRITGSGNVMQNGPQVTTDPLFCALPPCAGGATTEGDYSLASGGGCASPCLPDGNDCAVQIGALAGGCTCTAAEPRTWGSIRASYR